MKYGKICKAEFIERPNRFVAVVRLKEEGDSNRRGSEPGEQIVRVHVKNTGRCREILVPGAELILEDFRDRMGSRKMEYSLIAVYKDAADNGSLLINMDSQAPNAAVREMLEEGSPALPGLKYPLSLIKPEAKFGDSRLDFYVEDAGAEGGAGDAARDAARQKAFIEVKGVTLEDKGIVRFPDAPTERGTKHLKELQRAAAEGYAAYVVFVIQMDRAEKFEPNAATDPVFAKELARAADSGVQVLAYTCRVAENGMSVHKQLPVEI